MGTLSKVLNLSSREVLSAPGTPRSARLFWWGKDSEERYRSKGGHPVYGPGDITYEFNSCGYRCPEFTKRAAIRIASFGCSYVVGDAVPQNEVFHEILARHVAERTGASVVNWNLGAGGTSNDFLIRSLHAALPVLDPQIVLVSFTFPDRREFVDPEGNLFHVISKRGAVATPENLQKQQLRGLEGLISGNDDVLNLYRAYAAVEALLKKRFWLFTAIKDETLSQFKHLINHERYLGPFPRIDTGRDHAHPGRQSHRALADLIISRLDTRFREGVSLTDLLRGPHV